MIAVVSEIDRAIKRLYHLDTSLCSEQFLIDHIPHATHIRNREFRGALFIVHEETEADLSVGIYFDPVIKKQFHHWPSNWHYDLSAMDAFSIVCEEVSHFLYLAYHLSSGRSVSRLELELQAEVDKFVLSYLFLSRKHHSIYNALYDRFFFGFKLPRELLPGEKDRYLEANSLAKRFIRRVFPLYFDQHKRPKAFQALRYFYRSTLAEKARLAG